MYLIQTSFTTYPIQGHIPSISHSALESFMLSGSGVTGTVKPLAILTRASHSVLTLLVSYAFEYHSVCDKRNITFSFITLINFWLRLLYHFHHHHHHTPVSWYTDKYQHNPSNPRVPTRHYFTVRMSIDISH